jgi:MFS superfamily sulfate permease-like transporter
LLTPGAGARGIGERAGRSELASRQLAGVGWRRLAVVAIKLLHTAAFAVISTSILYVFARGVCGRPTRWTRPAVAIVLAEMVVFAGNRWRCPLTGLAESLGAESGRVTDIFLPRWFADRIPELYTPPFIVGLLGLLWHHWRESTRTSRASDDA